MEFVASVESQLAHRHRSQCARTKEFSQSYWARELALEQPEGYSDVPVGSRLEALKRFGDFSLAYSTAVQPLLRHFGDETGYLAYRQRFGVTVVLGDPVVSRANLKPLIRRFIGAHHRPVFCQVSRATAQLLSEEGYFVNELGVDTTIPLGEYTFDGREKEWLRYATNWTERRGFRVIQSDFDQIDVDRVEEISEAWRKTRTVKRKEIRFMNRPIVLEPESDVRRYFLVDSQNQVQAFVFFDPLYRAHGIIGYVTSIKRRHPQAPRYAEQAIMKAAIEDMKNEGFEKLNLGLSPFAWINDNSFSHSKFLARMFRWAYRTRFVNRYSYNLQGHAYYKRRFRGVEEKVYFASPTRSNLRPLAAVIGLCGVA